MTGHAGWRHDAWVLALGLVALAGWEASGWDMALQHLAGGPQGFALNGAWFTRYLLHDGGRWLAGALLAWMAWQAWRARPQAAPGQPSRRDWAWALGLTVAAMTWVPVLKHYSRTSCPYNLAEFGGTAPYVPHWMLAVADGGPGHCFPSGHAVAAFGFFSLYFLWRGPSPSRARAWLAGVLAAGTLFGWAQLVRGAHFASHSMWSAWWCYAVCALAFGLREACRGFKARAARSAAAPD